MLEQHRALATSPVAGRNRSTESRTVKGAALRWREGCHGGNRPQIEGIAWNGEIAEYTRRLCCSLRLALKTTMLKLQAILHDGSVGMEFMTEDISEVDEMREQMLAFDCVAKVVVLGRTGLGQRVMATFSELRRDK